MTDAKDEEQKRGERQRGLSSSDEVALKNEWNLSGAEPVVLPSPCKSAWLASVHQRLSPTVHGLWGARLGLANAKLLESHSLSPDTDYAT